MVQLGISCSVIPFTKTPKILARIAPCLCCPGQKMNHSVLLKDLLVHVWNKFDIKFGIHDFGLLYSFKKI